MLSTLKERHANQNAEIQKVREELIRSESDLSAIRVEKAEIEGSFLRDKEEVRDLNRRMAEVTAQITTTKQEVEKVKRDAKQQKGLLAIARKQLATKESEKANVDQELEEAQQDLADTVKEREEADAVAGAKTPASPPPLPEPERVKSPADSLSFAAAHPLPITPDITGGGPLSPSGGKSNNPFERLAMSSGTSTPRSQSPFRSFSTASVPPPPGLSPPDVVVPTLDDPFGISQAFEAEPQPSSEVPPGNDAADMGVSTPKGKAIFEEPGELVSSPTDEELFGTPPTTTTPVNLDGDATPHIHSLDTAAAYFPALDEIPSGQGDGREHETDLLTDLHELDVNETDSDTDSDEEESHKMPSQDQEGRLLEVSPTKNDSVPPSAPVKFDDVFGAINDPPVVNAPAAPEAASQSDNLSPSQNGEAAFDAFGVPLTKPATSEDGQDSGFTFINTPVKVASKDSSGRGSSDEAFGKSSSSGPAQTVSSFSFESGFEDNFDFNTSSGTAIEVPPTTSSDALPVNGITTTKENGAATANSTQDIFSLPVDDGSSAALKAAPPHAPVSIGDAFSSEHWPVQTGTSQPEKTVANQPGLANISFEEAFGGLETSQALRLDDSFSTRASNVITNPVSLPQFDAGKQFPVVSPPLSPRGPASPRVTSSIRSSSPQPRPMSPPPRIASPKSQRPSTSSSSTKDVAHEKPPPPPRHSKLSVSSISNARGAYYT